LLDPRSQYDNWYHRLFRKQHHLVRKTAPRQRQTQLFSVASIDQSRAWISNSSSSLFASSNLKAKHEEDELQPHRPNHRDISLQKEKKILFQLGVCSTKQLTNILPFGQ
jgi:hypothetical protein